MAIRGFGMSFAGFQLMMRAPDQRWIRKVTYLVSFGLLFLSSLVSFALPPAGSPSDPDAIRKYLEVLLDDPTLEFCYEKILSLSERPEEIIAFVVQELEERTQSDPDGAYEYQILKTYFLYRHKKDHLSQTTIDQLKALALDYRGQQQSNKTGDRRKRAYNDLLMEMQLSVWEQDPDSPDSKEKLRDYYRETVLMNWEYYSDHPLLMKAILAFYFEESPALQKEGLEARRIFERLLLQMPDNTKAILHTSLMGDLDQPYASKKKLLHRIEASVRNREDEIQLRTQRLRWEGSALRSEQITVSDHEWDQYIADAFREIEEMATHLLSADHWRQDEMKRLRDDFRAMSGEHESIRIYRLAKEIGKIENKEVQTQKSVSLVEELSDQSLSFEEYSILLEIPLGAYWKRSVISIYIDQLRNNFQEAGKKGGSPRYERLLIRLLNDEDPVIYFTMSAALKTFQDVRFLIPYVRLLRDPRQYVRFNARAKLLRLRLNETDNPKINAAIDEILKEYPWESFLRQGGVQPIYDR